MPSIKKLSLTINSFDTSELLEPLISQVRDEVDHVACIYQKLSYWKNPIAEEDMDELNHLKSIGLVDELIEFKPDFTKYSREQECEKRNYGIELMRQNGSSHVLNCDADEIYDVEQFRNAKKFINERGFGITYCSYINYYKDLDHYLVYPFRPYVPWIHSTYFRYTYDGPAPGPTDPTRRINNPLNIGTHIFGDDVIRMNHLAWVRKDIRKKLENWSAKNYFSVDLIDKAVERWNNWKEGDDAVMLFNVPNNSIHVKKLDSRQCDVVIPWVEESAKEWRSLNGYV